MSFIKRRGFLIISVILYCMLLPILLLYTLGYNIDFSQKAIQKSVNVRIETYPLTSDIHINNQKVASYTPTDIRILDKNNRLLSLSKQDYVPESFIIRGVSDQNTSVRISSMRMLSTIPNTLHSFSFDTASHISFVDNHIFYAMGQSQFYIRPISILSSASSDTVIAQNTIQIDSDPLFEKVSESIYFDYSNKLVLWNIQNTWNILDLKNSWATTTNTIFALTEFNINSMVSVNEGYIVFTDKNHHLYQLNLTTRALSLIDTQAIAIKKSVNPSQIWLFNIQGVSIITDIKYDENNSIISLNASQSQDSYTEDFLTDAAQECLKTHACNFDVVSVLGGYVLLLDTTLVYLQNTFSVTQFTTIAHDITKLIVAGESIYFIDSLNTVSSYNTILKRYTTITTLSHTSTLHNIEYIPDWNRLIFYFDTFVSSLWFDPQVTNEHIIHYSDQKWAPYSCSIYLFDRILLCKEGTRIIYYQSNKLF